MLAYYVHHFSPYLIRFSGQWGIRYYGLAYVLGFAAFYFGHRILFRKGWSRLNADEAADLLTWLVAGVLIGGRLAYCLLYDGEHTLQDPLSIIAFWRDGGISGMASHGGFIGVVVAVALYARRHQHSFWEVMDNIVTVTSIGFFLGRLANFINGELWGRPSQVPWAVIFPQAPLVDGQMVPRHPSQLYEAVLEGLLPFVVIWFLRGKKLPAGACSLIFVALYAAARIVAESFREPDAQIGYYWGCVTQGQILSALFLVAIAILYVVKFRRKTSP